MFKFFNLLVFLLCISCATKREIAVTIDDLPVIGSWQKSKEEQHEIFYKTLNHFSSYDVAATGFVVGANIQKHHYSYLDDFVQKGNFIDNHTFTHKNLALVTAQEYIKDIKQGERAIEKWQKPSKFFRYPYLARGDSAEKRKIVERNLTENNYIIAPVTIDSNDWHFNSLYEKAVANKDKKLMQKIGDDYINYIKNQTYQAIKMTEMTNDKPVKHILLLHMNRINADYLGEVLEWYKSKNWHFISLKNAMTDPYFKQKENYIGSAGKTFPYMLLESK